MRERWMQYAPVPLRLVLGIAFMYHGLPKVLTATGHAQFTGMLVDLGVPAPQVMSWVVGLVEVLGAAALLTGIATTFASLVLIVHMFAAIALVHWPAGFNFMNIVGQSDAGPIFGMPGYEVNLLYIAGLVSLVLSGPGAMSPSKRRHTAQREQTVIRAEPEGAPIEMDTER